MGGVAPPLTRRNMFPVELAILLVLVAFLAGVGITTIGPGGIFVTIALFVLLPIDPAVVAGTASTTFVATGVIGSVAYARSGELRSSMAHEMAVILSVFGIMGALVGTRLNLYVSEFTFGVVLAVFVGTIGAGLLARELGFSLHRGHVRDREGVQRVTLGLVGLVIGVAGGMLGVGGPVLAVPLLVLLGVPMLVGLAVAQVQSIFIAGFAAIGYLSVGAVSWPLVVLAGVPQVIGVVVGWRIAHLVPARLLRMLLGVVLLVLAPGIVPLGVESLH